MAGAGRVLDGEVVTLQTDESSRWRELICCGCRRACAGRGCLSAEAGALRLVDGAAAFAFPDFDPGDLDSAGGVVFLG